MLAQWLEHLCADQKVFISTQMFLWIGASVEGTNDYYNYTTLPAEPEPDPIAALGHEHTLSLLIID